MDTYISAPTNILVELQRSVIISPVKFSDLESMTSLDIEEMFILCYSAI